MFKQQSAIPHRCEFYFPLVVFGFSDADHKFFPVAFFITSHEEAIDYISFLAEIKKLLLVHFEFLFEPNYIMSDAGKSITKSICTVFPHSIKLMCFFHVMHNVIIIIIFCIIIILYIIVCIHTHMCV